MTMHLTATERSLYDTLPAQLRTQWGGSVIEEKGTAWETAEDMEARVKLTDLSKHPKVAAYAKRAWVALQSGADIEPLSRDIPREALPVLLHLMGAVGISRLIKQLLSEAASAHDLEVIAEFSKVRHTILMTNAVIASALGQ